MRKRVTSFFGGDGVDGFFGNDIVCIVYCEFLRGVCITGNLINKLVEIVIFYCAEFGLFV